MYAKVSGTQGGLAKHLKSIINLVNMYVVMSYANRLLLYTVIVRESSH